MRAMVLAAGFGSRLRPLTDETPKALLEIERRPLLSMALEKIRIHEFDGAAVNTHHMADRIESWLDGSDFDGDWVSLVKEPEILGTGGAVKNAASLLADEDPVLIHNVDVLTNISFRRLYRAHEESEALVTMVVQHRETTRGLVVDEDGNLCGRAEQPVVRTPRGKLFPCGFNGISIISPGLAASLPGEGAFSLVDSYLTLAAELKRVRIFVMDAWYWADAGTPERLKNLKRDISTKKIPVESLYM